MTDYRKQFSKVARTLSRDRLRESSEITLQESFADLVHEARGKRLLDFYGDRGLLYAFERYGVTEKLKTRAYANFSVETSRQGDKHELKLFGQHAQSADQKHLLLQVVFSRAGPVREHESAPTLFVDYCLLQDPMRQFSRERPPLPAQDHPGLGMLGEVVALTERVAKRLRFGAVALVPQHFHSGWMYNRWLTPQNETFREELMSLATLLLQKERLSLAQASWALEWGCVIDADTRTPIAWHGNVMASTLTRASSGELFAQATHLPAQMLQAFSPSRFRLQRREFFARWHALLETLPRANE